MGKIIDNIAKGICAIVAIFAILLLIGLLFSGADNANSNPVPPIPTPTPIITIDDIKSSASSISYDELMRNSDDYIGEVVHKRGEILQVLERRSNKYVLRVATKQSTYGYYEDIIWIEYEGDRLLEGDIIAIWGEYKGIKTAKTVIGGETSMPKVDSLHVELITKAGSR